MADCSAGQSMVVVNFGVAGRLLPIPAQAGRLGPSSKCRKVETWLQWLVLLFQMGDCKSGPLMQTVSFGVAGRLHLIAAPVGPLGPRFKCRPVLPLSKQLPALPLQISDYRFFALIMPINPGAAGRLQP